jgi:diaminopimelate decarboxylase
MNKIKPAILREALVRTSPVLLFDYETFEGNFKSYRKHTSEHEATWSFAVKSFARNEVLEVAKTYIDGFDISNIEEWKLIKDHVSPEHKIWLTNASYSELDYFKKNVPNIIVTVNDLNDFNAIKKLQVPYVVRVATSELLPQNANSRFGLTLHQLHSISSEMTADKNFKGFHCHQGIEDNSYPILHKILSSIQTKLKEFSGKGYIFNIGGGWQQFSEEEIKSSLDQLKGQYKVHIEPGRAMFRGAGFALAPIDKFIVDGDTLRLFTRLSFISHLKWSKPVFAGILNQSENLEQVTPNSLVLEGPSCYEFDKSETIKIDFPIAITKGSLVVLENISSYSTEWNTPFNGIPECDVKFVGRRRPDSP